MIKRNRGQNLQSDIEIGGNHSFLRDGVSPFCLFAPFFSCRLSAAFGNLSSPFGRLGRWSEIPVGAAEQTSRFYPKYFTRK